MRKLFFLTLIATATTQAWAGAALLIDGKVMGYEKPNFKILAPKYEFVIDGSKINDLDFEKLRKASKSQVVRAKIPREAIVSTKKLAKADTGSKKRSR